uniref:Nipped-B protein n=1 Tax=Trichuris muris TaxID=70415 RepID=A0A5S6Q9S7_TRIMR
MNKPSGRYLVPGNSLMSVPVSDQVMASILPRVALDDSSPNSWKTLLFHPVVYDTACQLETVAPPQLAVMLVQALSKVNTDRMVHLKPRSPKNVWRILGGTMETDQLYSAIKELSPSIFDSSTAVGLLSQDDRGAIDKRIPNDKTDVPAISKAALHPLGRIPSVSSPEQQEPLRPASPTISTPLGKRENFYLDYNPSAVMEEAVRKRIVSIGKQPKACVRKKKDLVSELFDSLTPESQYFVEGSRRRRAAPKSYSEEDLPQMVVYDQYDSDIDDDLLPQSLEVSSPSTLIKPKEDRDVDVPTVEERPLTPPEVIEEREREWSEMLRRKKEKLRLRGTGKAAIDVIELAENESYKRFLALMDRVFELFEDIELGAEAASSEDLPTECLISRLLLSDLCSEMAKLKAIDALHRIPVDRLCKLVAILDRNVRDGIKFAPDLWIAIEHGDHINREVIDDHVQRSCDAAHAVTILMSSAFMPKQIYVEDTIETVTTFTRTILQSVIYPTFDPQYRPARESNNVNEDGKGISCQAKNVKRTKAPAVKDRVVLHIYSRVAETISDLGELVNVQTLTDTCILQLSVLGVSAFFVENLGDLQLSSLRLLSNVFAKYERHRQLILEDILTSVYRLPSMKRGLRTYRLAGETSIQMVTALIMQLIQSVICVALNTQDRNYFDELENRLINIDSEQPKSAEDVSSAVLSSYETAVSTAHGFLTVYLKKCTTKSDEDYRPLFEDFIKDLLEALNRPEWPSAEILLKLLAGVLVKHFTSKQNEITMRVASLDYLGMIAARIRRDSMLASDDAKVVNEMVARLSREKAADPFEVFVRPDGVDDESTVTLLILQKALNFYLANLSNRNNSIEIARRSHIAQWFRDVTNDLEKTITVGKRDQHTTVEDAGVKAMDDNKKLKEAFQKAAAAKEYLHSLVNIDEDVFAYVRLRREDFILTEQQAYVIVRYLALRRPLMQSFDYYLGQIMRTLGDTVVAIRTKGMKCLSSSVEVDPEVLFTGNLQVKIMSKFHDQSSNVREAAVELIGKLLSVRPNTVEIFYQVLMDRLLDAGISVRKRAIRILKEFCERRPDFDRISEIYSRILRRASDEESIVKLVADTFHALWFTPSRDRDSEALMNKVVSIIDVVAILSKEGFAFDSLEVIFGTILKKDVDGSALLAARQIVSCLVENVLVIEERLVDSTNSKSYQRLLFCLSTVYVFSKVEARLMVPYIETMQPYLSMQCTNIGENSVLMQVMKIVEMVVPLIEHPNVAFLEQIEEALGSLIAKSTANVVQAAVSCLSVIVPLTKDYVIVVELFNKFRNVLEKVQSHCDDEDSFMLRCPPVFRPTILRALFTIGLIFRYFDIDCLLPVDSSTKNSWTDQVFRQLLFFASRDDDDARARAIAGLGSFCVGHPNCLLQKELTDFYLQVLTSKDSIGKFRVQVLKNLEMFLIEEEQKMLQSYAEWEKNRASENLKEMGESTSGLSSTVIQSYLRAVLDCFYSVDCEVRKTACGVIVRTLQQGLIHPGQAVLTVEWLEAVRESRMWNSSRKTCMQSPRARSAQFETKVK